MQRLDHEYMMRPSECPVLKKKPSEYMRDMYYSTQPMEIQDHAAMEQAFRMMNAETQLLYASDYPHWDFDLPSTIYDLPFLSEKAKHNILGGTAARLFKLPPRNERQKANLDQVRQSGGVTRRLPVVFIHGIGGSARVWTPQLASFDAAGLAPVALDLPGFGARAPVAAMTFDELAADIEAAVERAGLARPVLVGHSLGGMVVQTALRRRPDAYRAAVLCCTSAAFGNPTGDFQRKFVTDRLGPLDAGRTMAEIAPEIVDQMVGPCTGIRPGARSRSK